METKQKTLAIHSILSSPRGLLLAHLPPDKRSSFTSIKCIEYTTVAQQFHHSFFSKKKKKKIIIHFIIIFAKPSVNIIYIWSFSFVAKVHSMDSILEVRKSNL